VAIVQVKDLIEAGVHFGHRASRWNPKMRPYIYGKRNLIHIIDLRETVRGLLRAYRFLTNTAAKRQPGALRRTKRQAKEAIERESQRCGMPLRQRTLARRHAHQLPHHPRSAETPARARSDVGRPARTVKPTSPAICGRC